MYGEPDWSHLSPAQLLDKASTFAKQAYAGSLSSNAFLMRAVEASPKGTDLTEDLLDLLEHSSAINKQLAEIFQKIEKLTQEAATS